MNSRKIPIPTIMTRVFKCANYEQPIILSPTIDEWFLSGRLAHFILNIIEVIQD
jgi:hypothetical protein